MSNSSPDNGDSQSGSHSIGNNEFTDQAIIPDDFVPKFSWHVNMVT